MYETHLKNNFNCIFQLYSLLNLILSLIYVELVHKLFFYVRCGTNHATTAVSVTVHWIQCQLVMGLIKKFTAKLATVRSLDQKVLAMDTHLHQSQRMENQPFNSEFIHYLKFVHKQNANQGGGVIFKVLIFFYQSAIFLSLIANNQISNK